MRLSATKTNDADPAIPDNRVDRANSDDDRKVLPIVTSYAAYGCHPHTPIIQGEPKAGRRPIALRAAQLAYATEGDASMDSASTTLDLLIDLESRHDELLTRLDEAGQTGAKRPDRLAGPPTAG